ncbi:hypothetical protein KFE25_013969 [Diacronema lutheri]|uniref:Uncharacterized protein n=1 Tax=Diacronema lutheri TaxID=2081491 RepID=A0A8J5XMS2_DIALT|nr:hypothetical protein KFE25_013969 [Diacronema lutheri]
MAVDESRSRAATRRGAEEREPRGYRDVERAADAYEPNFKPRGSAGNYVAASETPAVRKAKRDSNLLAKKTRAVLRLQAAFRGKRARREAAAKAKKPSASSFAEFRSNIEPYIATAFATCIAVQWDSTIERVVDGDPNKPGLSLVNAVGTTLYTSILYVALVCVHASLNKRLLNLIKQSLQILVGWMWKGVVVAVDDNIVNFSLSFEPGREKYIQAGYMFGWAIFIAPVFVGVIVLLMHPGRTTARETFLKHFSGLLLGASALMIGFSWFQAMEHLSIGFVFESEGSSLSLRLLAAILRSAFLQVVLGVIKARTPLEHASKVHKGPKPTDTLGKSFYDSSIFVGGKTLSYICGFSWFSIVRALATLVKEDANGWGGYIVFTLFIFVFLAHAAVLAYLGAPRPLCCGPIKPLGNGELLFYSTIAIQLGWATQNSYNSLIAILEGGSDERLDTIAWAIGAALMLTLWLLILFFALFGNIVRTRKQEQDMAQL